jgi:hypothetical protein
MTSTREKAILVLDKIQTSIFALLSVLRFGNAPSRSFPGELCALVAQLSLCGFFIK